MRVSTRADVSPAPSVEQFTMVPGGDKCRDRSRGHDSGGCGSFGGEHESYGGRQSGFDKGPRQCKHCGKNNHISKKCWDKFSWPEWAQLVDTNSPTSDGATHSSSFTSSGSSSSSAMVLL